MYKNVLYAADLSKHSEEVVEQAKKLCKLYNADFKVMHVVEPIPRYINGYFHVDFMEDKLEQEAKDNLDSFCKVHEIKDDHRYLAVGNPKTKIVEFAKELGADLIIVGTHGAKGLVPMLGSTASYVLTHANCDVLTVPQRKK